jgi:FkbM family methyltransferase
MLKSPSYLDSMTEQRRNKMAKKYFYEETGMYVDWPQLDRLPKIDTLIDIGVGPKGTADLYDRFHSAKLLLIDPLNEAETYVNEQLGSRDVMFHKCAVGAESGELILNVEEKMGRSTLLKVADINYEGEPLEQYKVQIKTLDAVVESEKELGRLGIKIDTEGFELNVILGASKTLKSTDFVIAEVRHNHESFEGVYKLHEFVSAMHDNGFVLTMILTAKPFIADLCFQPKNKLGL